MSVATPVAPSQTIVHIHQFHTPEPIKFQLVNPDASKHSSTLEKIKTILGYFLLILGALLTIASMVGALALLQGAFVSTASNLSSLFMPGLVSLLSGLNLLSGGKASMSYSLGGGSKATIGDKD